MVCVQSQLQTIVSGLNAATDSLRQNATEIAAEITTVTARISGPVLDDFINGVSWKFTLAALCVHCASVYHMYMHLIALDCERIHWSCVWLPVSVHQSP